MSTPDETDPLDRDDDTAETDVDEGTPRSPGPPPHNPLEEDVQSVDSPDDEPSSPGPPPGTVPGDR
ncbi:hypothetical protein [Ornithinimicrobium cavernae]|uniref:hypothetical protein n=1 Tax=Ornithinimicrobium cavernae TaxID=2666047 RepID=UPI000D687CE3|nr:hypothetical protein [Ornithinimicrobium cavernae]